MIIVKKYVIRYKITEDAKYYSYFKRTKFNTTYSSKNIDDEEVKKMTLIEAKEEVVKIEKLDRSRADIKIIDIETNEEVDIHTKYTKYTRFEIMDI